MSTPKYPSYKDVPIPWISSIPEHWDWKPVLGAACERDEDNKGMKEDNLLSLSYGNIVNKDINTSDGLLPESFETYQIVRPGDIVLRLTDLQNDKRSLRSALVTQTGIITSAYLALKPESIDPKYLGYLLRAYDGSKVFYSMGGGLRQSMKYGDIKRMPLVIPTKSEQSEIASFLDRETAKIDALIAEQHRLVELLQEKRQAVISYAVTKGLNANAPMKDSGVEWLGEVPEHWEVAPLKHHWLVTDCKHVTAEFTQEGYPLASIKEAQGRWIDLTNAKRTTEDFYNLLTEGSRTPEPGDLVFTRNATVGEVAEVPAQIESFALGQDVVILKKLNDSHCSSFAWHLLRSTAVSNQLECAMIGSTFRRINVEQIKAISVPIPPSHEQASMAIYLEEVSGQWAKQEQDARHCVSLLQERRSALISAAVTGQIDVRGLALEVAA